MSQAEIFNGVFDYRSAQTMLWILTEGVSHLAKHQRWGGAEVWCGARVVPEGDPEIFTPCQKCLLRAIPESDNDSAVVRWHRAVLAGERVQDARSDGMR